MPVSHAHGVALLLHQQNEARAKGDVAALKRCVEQLERYLGAAAAADELSLKSEASCAALLPQPDLPGGDATGEAGRHGRGYANLRDAPHRYCVSSSTLADAYAYLTQRLPDRKQEPEFMLAVTGARVDSVRTLERLIEVHMSQQSFGEASFDIEDFVRRAVTLSDHGMALHAVFHSHRFSGAPGPSGTDIRFQAFLEEAGYPAIQAVFSEDGYVHFFAKKRAFRIEIHGTGAKQVDGRPNTFRIVQFSTLPYPALGAPAAGRSAGVRPLPASPGR